MSGRLRKAFRGARRRLRKAFSCLRGVPETDVECQGAPPVAGSSTSSSSSLTSIAVLPPPVPPPSPSCSVPTSSFSFDPVFPAVDPRPFEVSCLVRRGAPGDHLPASLSSDGSLRAVVVAGRGSVRFLEVQCPDREASSLFGSGRVSRRSSIAASRFLSALDVWPEEGDFAGSAVSGVYETAPDLMDPQVFASDYARMVRHQKAYALQSAEEFRAVFKLYMPPGYLEAFRPDLL